MRTFTVVKGEAKTIQVDFASFAGRGNVTVDTVTWAVSSGSALISEQSLTSGIAQALVSFPNTGKSEISITADLSDSQVAVEEITFIVKQFNR